MKKFLKVLIIFFVCFAVIMTTGTYIFLNNISKGQEYNVDSEDTDEVSGFSERINVLIVGVDAKDPKSAQKARTDTIMVATFDPETPKLDIISIPRDTRTIIRGYKSQDKINHAHVYGGIELSMKTVKDLLGVPIHYYVRIDYNALGKIVDDLGGVEVYVPMDMKYTDPYADPPLKINLKKGQQVLDGEKAMQFVRYRKGYENQDLGRISAQHEFLKAIADKLLAPQTILKLPKLAKTFSTYVETDMPISTMAGYALKATKLKKENIHMTTIPGESKYISGVSYFIADKDKLEEMIQEIFGDQTNLAKNTNADSSTSKESTVKKVSVEVLNGSNISGLATKVAKKLEEEGFYVKSVGNIKGMSYSQTHIYDRKSNVKEAKEIAKILGVKKIETDLKKEADVDITIIVGEDMNQ